MNKFPNCRFLDTAQSMSEEVITPDELRVQFAEFISVAQNFLCGQPYLDVLDAFDTMILSFDEVMGRKKKAWSWIS